MHVQHVTDATSNSKYILHVVSFVRHSCRKYKYNVQYWMQYIN